MRTEINVREMHLITDEGVAPTIEVSVCLGEKHEEHTATGATLTQALDRAVANAVAQERNLPQTGALPTDAAYEEDLAHGDDERRRDVEVGEDGPERASIGRAYQPHD